MDGDPVVYRNLLQNMRWPFSPTVSWLSVDHGIPSRTRPEPPHPGFRPAGAWGDEGGHDADPGVAPVTDGLRTANR